MFNSRGDPLVEMFSVRCNEDGEPPTQRVNVTLRERDAASALGRASALRTSAERAAPPGPLRKGKMGLPNLTAALSAARQRPPLWLVSVPGNVPC